MLGLKLHHVSKSGTRSLADISPVHQRYSIIFQGSEFYTYYYHFSDVINIENAYSFKPY